MKPVVIIAISVVCSLISVFGALIGYEMYLLNQMENATSFGVEVANIYEQYIPKISNCIPNDYSCFTNTLNQFENQVERLADNYNIDYDSESFQEYHQYAKKLLEIEYDYQNQLYQIQLDDLYFDSELYGTGSPELDNIVNSWQLAYQNAISSAGNEDTIKHFQDTRVQERWDSCPEELSLMECLQMTPPESSPESSPKMHILEPGPVSSYISPKSSETETAGTTTYKIKGGDRLVVSLLFDTSQKTILTQLSRETDHPQAPPSTEEIFNSKICKLTFHGEYCEQGSIPLELWFGEYLLSIDGNEIPITINADTPKLPYFN